MEDTAARAALLSSGATIGAHGARQAADPLVAAAIADKAARRERADAHGSAPQHVTTLLGKRGGVLAEQSSGVIRGAVVRRASSGAAGAASPRA